MSDKPAPYPADTKAKGWRFEVDMEAVKASETWLRAKRGDVRGALLLLWAEAWQQTPCGTLPNDDELVALLIDMAASTFIKHRAVLMRGWWQADDGRLYHDTITARVLAMLDKRANDATRAANRRAKLLASQASQPEVTGASRVTPPGLGSEFDTKHQAPSTSNTSPGGDVGAAEAASTAKPAAGSRGKRLPQDWTLPKAWGDWALSEYQHWTPDIVRLEAARFADHWHAQTGKGATKADWPATWRNWCRSDICQRAHTVTAAGQRASGLSAAGSATLEASRSLEKKLFGEPA